MTARPADPAGLAGRLWDLTAWSARARALLRDLDALPPDGPEALAPGFELSAAVLRHLQADPLLPAELLPADWPGAPLRSTYDRWDARYRTTLRDWSRAG
jgi:phenylacetic acid degradation operon negative regulatory protein